ncbi:hypothetical protein ACE7GA_20990 [Roseomonas sp. CCTCC AB2023176]|uniref:hypothetical protein n=1 Tax=Roseomonas sp. CCTCC AB2023176 TaxID=3342640 RepID=UPI0035E23D55
MLRHTGRTLRGIHAKSHALLEGELTVLPDLPPELAQGMFARPATHPLILHLSTNRPDILDDEIGAPRGVALKVIGVDDPRLEGAEPAPTQDRVMVNQPFFTEPDLRTFVRNIRFVDATTQTGLLWKKVLAALPRPPVALLRALGGWAATPTTMGGHPPTHPLGDPCCTQVAFRFGEHVEKLALVPASDALRALSGQRLHLRGRPNRVREAMIAHFARYGGAWDLRVQLQTDAATMPVEDAAAQ